MASTGTNTPTTTPNVNLMGWTDEDIASLIRCIRRVGCKLHLGRCSVNVRIPNTYERTNVNIISAEDVINGNLNGREICRNSQCREAFDDLKKDQRQKDDDDIKKKLERLDVLEKAEEARVKEKEERRKAEEKEKEKAKAKKELKQQLVKAGINTDIIDGIDFSKVLPSVVPNESGEESKETEEVDNNELIPYNSLSTMDIDSNSTNVIENDEESLIGLAGAGAGEEPEVKPKRKYNKKKKDENDNDNA